jgi:hypothetical protein
MSAQYILALDLGTKTDGLPRSATNGKRTAWKSGCAIAPDFR